MLLTIITNCSLKCLPSSNIEFIHFRFAVDIEELPGTLRPDGVLEYNYRIRERRPPLPPRNMANLVLRDSDLVVRKYKHIIINI